MNKTNFTINALAIAFVAVFIEQVGHESSHRILAMLVGAQWTQLNLFFAEHTWAGDMNQAGEAILTGGAAIEETILPEPGETLDPARAFTVRAFFPATDRANLARAEQALWHLAQLRAMTEPRTRERSVSWPWPDDSGPCAPAKNVTVLATAFAVVPIAKPMKPLAITAES